MIYLRVYQSSLTLMFKYHHKPDVERIHLEQEAGLSYFQLSEVMDAFHDLSLDVALIRASNSSIGRYVRVTKGAVRGHWDLYDVQIWVVDTPRDVLGPFYYGDSGQDEIHRARGCLRTLKATPGSDILVETMDNYLAATNPELHGSIFRSESEPELVPRKVGHLTVVK